MTQEIKLDAKEVMTRLAKLQADVEYIKSYMKLKDVMADKELIEEMKMWEQASAEDSADFFEKHNL